MTQNMPQNFVCFAATNIKTAAIEMKAKGGSNHG